MVLSGGAALLLFFLTWLREREAQSALPLAVLGFAWVVCHVMVFKLSYLVPPKEAVDWLVPGAAGGTSWAPAPTPASASVASARTFARATAPQPPLSR